MIWYITNYPGVSVVIVIVLYALAMMCYHLGKQFLYWVIEKCQRVDTIEGENT